MKIALIGRGKTGKMVEQLLQEKTGITFQSFASQSPLKSALQLSTFDVAIVFVTAEVFESLVPLFLNAKTPLVIGTTGLDWKKKFSTQVQSQDCAWLYAANFSLGIQHMRQLLRLQKSLYQESILQKISLHEIHHIHKKDHPSGTAKALASWVSPDVTITAERIGDEVGFHEMTFDYGLEKIKLSHQALDRRVFAQGAIQIAQEWHCSPMGKGLFSLEDFSDFKQSLNRHHPSKKPKESS
jgi:4-hydroxy-tetrahydrodipicolinate reductase